MRILILGGTSFVGRAIVEELLRRRGHDVTLFGRGKTGPELFPGVERRTGDRSTGDYAALAGGEWDAVVDVSGYVPRHVGQAMDALGSRVGRYLFISTGSVYDYKQAPAHLDEDCPRLEPRRDTEDHDGPAYGQLKVACEDDVLARFGDRATIVRPGVVAGPHDPTDRFTFWVRKAAGGGRVEVPGRLAQPVQVVDAEDLAVLVVSLLERDQPGIYNAVGPSMPFAELIRACSIEPVELVEVSEGPAPLLFSDPSLDIMFTRSAARAHAAGMPQTPLAETAAKVRAWDVARGEPALSV